MTTSADTFHSAAALAGYLESKWCSGKYFAASKNFRVTVHEDQIAITVLTPWAARSRTIRKVARDGWDGRTIELAIGEKAHPAVRAWSTRDADHIRKGCRVMIRIDPATLHPSIVEILGLLGMSVDAADHNRYGTVLKRWFGGDYFVQVEGGRLSLTLEPKHVLYPIPENVLPLAKPKKRVKRGWRR